MQTTVRHLLEVKGYNIWSISPGASVYDALRMMSMKDVGALMVMEGDKMVGILSERDYARKVVLVGKTSRETLVSEIMSSKVFSIHPDQTVEEAMDLMNSKRIRHVPVVADRRRDGRDIDQRCVRAIIYKQREAIKSLEESVYKEII
jgi:CBS domain-containing protein